MVTGRHDLLRCGLCDTTYSPQHPAAVAIHEHPEPQSGHPRGLWLVSKLPYDRWSAETPAGRAWASRQAKPLCTACGGTGSLLMRIQRRAQGGGRVCTEEARCCPVCYGSQHANEADFVAFDREEGDSYDGPDA